MYADKVGQDGQTDRQRQIDQIQSILDIVLWDNSYILQQKKKKKVCISKAMILQKDLQNGSCYRQPEAAQALTDSFHADTDYTWYW